MKNMSGNKKRRISKIIIAVIFIVGIAILLSPVVGNIIAVIQQNSIIDDYNRQITDLDAARIASLKESAKKYNDNLINGNSDGDVDKENSSDENDGYYSAIAFDHDIIGYLEIEKVNVNLPIYNSTDDLVLQAGIGHLKNTSLPVGGTDTHAVLTGHTGLPNARLLTDLDKLEVGDMFRIHILDEVLTYKVDQIKVVEPEDREDLKIVSGKDYVTLVTCTPYGINSHRLLVRGERVNNTDNNTYENDKNTFDNINNSTIASVFGLQIPFWSLYIIIPLILIIAVTVIIIVKAKSRKNKNNRYMQREEN